MQPLQILLKGTFAPNWILAKQLDSKSSDCRQVGVGGKKCGVEIFVVNSSEFVGMAV